MKEKDVYKVRMQAKLEVKNKMQEKDDKGKVMEKIELEVHMLAFLGDLVENN